MILLVCSLLQQCVVVRMGLYVFRIILRLLDSLHLLPVRLESNCKDTKERKVHIKLFNQSYSEAMLPVQILQHGLVLKRSKFYRLQILQTQNFI